MGGAGHGRGMLHVAHLSVEYPATRTDALRDVDLDLRDEKMVLVGANGSGKTTLFKALLGLVGARTGRIELFGEDVRSVRGMTQVATNLPEVFRLVSLPVEDLVAVYARLKGGSPAEPLERLRAFDLTGVLPKRIFELSMGQQKMLGNLLAVCFEPRLVLLDEPFDNVDFERRRRLVRLLNELPAELLLSTHELDLLARFPGWRLAFMFEGRLFGPFRVEDLDRLYLSRGRASDARAVLETRVGAFSVTLDRGERPIKSATSLGALMEALP
jgi:ABC-type multidrug transport system ATPase subunit